MKLTLDDDWSRKCPVCEWGVVVRIYASASGRSQAVPVPCTEPGCVKGWIPMRKAS
jgi:hypothetical protein